MADRFRLEQHRGKWHVLALTSAETAAEAAWVSLGGCGSQVTATRVWLACLGRGTRQ